MASSSEANAGKEIVSPYQLFMLALCIYVLAVLVVETVVSLEPETVSILTSVDAAICVIFLGDFLVRLVTAESKLGYLKWGWIDLISSIPMFDYARWGRLARIMRIVRLLRGVRSAKWLTHMAIKKRAESVFLSAMMLTFITIGFGSIAILHCERDVVGSNIKDASDAIWWAFVTVTTVGYGDHFPVSEEGRFVASILMLVGVGLFGTFSGFVASWFLSEQENNAEVIKELRCQVAALEAENRVFREIAGK